MAAPDITLLNATYSGVKGVTLPVSGGGTATFPWVEGSETKTANGTYDVTNLAQLVVNVSGGGGGWTKLGSTEMAISTSNTSAQSAGTFSTSSAAFDKTKLIYIRVRDKAGPRAGYFYGSDAFFANFNNANGSTSSFTNASRSGLFYNTSNKWAYAAASYGAYAYSIATDGTITMRKRYSSSYGTVNGTFLIEVYSLDYPDGKSPFATGVIT